MENRLISGYLYRLRLEAVNLALSRGMDPSLVDELMRACNDKYAGFVSKQLFSVDPVSLVSNANSAESVESTAIHLFTREGNAPPNENSRAQAIYLAHWTRVLLLTELFAQDAEEREMIHRIGSAGTDLFPFHQMGETGPPFLTVLVIVFIRHNGQNPMSYSASLFVTPELLA